MPSSSKKQHNFMAAVANSPKFAKKVGVPQTVGKEFSQADKGRKFSKGGDMKSVDMKKNPGMAKLPTAVRNKMGFMKTGGKVHDDAKADMKMDMKQDKSMMQKAVNKHEGRLHKGSPMTKLSKGGGVESKGKTKGKVITMKSGGRAC
jgi:hypothetical protein